MVNKVLLKLRYQLTIRATTIINDPLHSQSDKNKRFSRCSVKFCYQICLCGGFLI